MLHEIAGRPIGPDAPVFVIAEIGLNHDGSVDQALDLVDAAASAGASAVKLQTLDADRLVAAACPAPSHVPSASLRAFFARFELDIEAHRRIIARARERDLAVVATPLFEAAVPMLDALGVDAFKIASGDLTYDGLIVAAARTRKPIVLSTGMATLDEARRAMLVAQHAGGRAIAVLHCVSSYPVPAAQENLRAISTLGGALGVPVGLSDHGSGLASAVAAATLGARLYERHLMLDRTPDVIDAAVSSTPAELQAIVAALRHARVALGDGRKVCQPAEEANRAPSRRGLYAARALRAGDRVSPEHITALRPASGLAPADIPLLLGATLSRDLAAGEPFTRDDLAGAGRGRVAGLVLERAS